MTNFIEQVRKANADAEVAKLERLRANEKLLIEKREREVSLALAWADDAMVICRQNILREAGDGNTSYYHVVCSTENDVSDTSMARSTALTKLLVAEGFAVKKSIETHEPCGSDSYFDRTCYSTSLKISW